MYFLFFFVLDDDDDDENEHPLMLLRSTRNTLRLFNISQKFDLECETVFVRRGRESAHLYIIYNIKNLSIIYVCMYVYILCIVICYIINNK
jgi:hypothetical protein